MTLRQCKSCGGELELIPSQSIYQCQSCGSVFEVDPEDFEYQAYLNERQDSLQQIEDAKRRQEKTRKKIGKVSLCVIGAIIIAIAIYFCSQTIRQAIDDDRSRQELRAQEEQRHIEEMQLTHIQIPESSRSYQGEDAQSVATELVDIGFQEIRFIQIDDLSIIDMNQENGSIERISINGISQFSKGDWFPNDSKVTITYHAIWHSKPYDSILNRTGQAQVPHKAKYYSGKNYEQIKTEFEHAGFSNIEVKALEDMGFMGGVTKKEGGVSQVAINGSTDFEEGEWFSSDAEVVITYHSRSTKQE